MRQAMAADKYIVGVCLGAQLYPLPTARPRALSVKSAFIRIELTAEGLADAHVPCWAKP